MTEPTEGELHARAEQLYNACQTPKPAWRQLGDRTKSVWLGYAAKEARQRAEQEVPVPPAGYTAEELERDNPYNQWMRES